MDVAAILQLITTATQLVTGIQSIVAQVRPALNSTDQATVDAALAALIPVEVADVNRALGDLHQASLL